MTKIDVISGFLGAGKTTLIKKLLQEALKDEQIVLIENEFGEIGVDGGFLKDTGVQITEMSQGCICCSLVGDFVDGLREVVEKYHPDRIIIEPSGVGKLSDVMAAVKKVADEVAVELNSATTVADAKKARVYMKNFGEFFDNQIENAGAIVLSRTQSVSEEKLAEAVKLLRAKNEKARILTTPWDDLPGARILEVMTEAQDLTLELMALARDEEEDEDDDEDEHEHHHHHHHDEDHDHDEYEHHDHDEEDHDHDEHEHHDHDEEDHDHEHHHDHDEDDHDEEHEHHH
ncbi:MAG: GTP-binding protein, partial [Lachnospiraceae bacterium]|nr:GTP-binding protein [Lachnospiraceae bacterium]